MPLYHYTCEHAIGHILRSGRVSPMATPGHLDQRLRAAGLPPSGLREPVCWLTDMKWPDALALGLQSRTLTCDRTLWRVSVDAPHAEAWRDFVQRVKPNPAWVRTLEFERKPRRWYVSERSLTIVAVKQMRQENPA